MIRGRAGFPQLAVEETFKSGSQVLQLQSLAADLDHNAEAFFGHVKTNFNLKRLCLTIPCAGYCPWSCEIGSHVGVSRPSLFGFWCKPSPGWCVKFLSSSLEPLRRNDNQGTVPGLWRKARQYDFLTHARLNDSWLVSPSAASTACQLCSTWG